jgi:hypothetical protein
MVGRDVIGGRSDGLLHGGSRWVLDISGRRDVVVVVGVGGQWWVGWGGWSDGWC